MLLIQTKATQYTSGEANDIAPATNFKHVNLHSISIVGGTGTLTDVTLSDSGTDPVGPTLVFEVRTDSGTKALPVQFKYEGIQFKQLRVNLGATPAEVIIEYSYS